MSDKSLQFQNEMLIANQINLKEQLSYIRPRLNFSSLNMAASRVGLLKQLLVNVQLIDGFV